MQPVFPVIMSGGSGTRLWPMSRRAHPKQLLPLTGEQTMLQETARRVAPMDDGIVFGPLYVIGSAAHQAIVEEQLGAFDLRLQALEPFGRNTAPAAAVAALLVSREAPDAILMLLAADHFIADVAAFRRAAAQAAAEAQSGRIVTFGIVPHAPETGYGYIKMSDEISQNGAHRIARFVEKPDLATAQSYLEESGYVWNSGMFVARADILLAEMRQFCPQIVTAAQAALDQGRVEGRAHYLDPQAFAECSDISIDYAVMERTTRASVLPVLMGWNDVGAWSALWDIGERDNNGNIVAGDVLLKNVRNSYIRSASRAVAVVGLEDIVVIETPDAVLVLPREKAQDVKFIVEQLKAAKRTEL